MRCAVLDAEYADALLTTVVSWDDADDRRRAGRDQRSTPSDRQIATQVLVPCSRVAPPSRARGNCRPGRSATPYASRVSPIARESGSSAGEARHARYPTNP